MADHCHTFVWYGVWIRNILGCMFHGLFAWKVNATQGECDTSFCLMLVFSFTVYVIDNASFFLSQEKRKKMYNRWSFPHFWHHLIRNKARPNSMAQKKEKREKKKEKKK